VAVARHADGTAILYANGVELGRGHTQPGSLPRDGNPLIIGAAVNGPDPGLTESRFDGLVGEVLVYDRALPPSQIAALAAGQRP
jgi:hypothetical protein